MCFPVNPKTVQVEKAHLLKLYKLNINICINTMPSFSKYSLQGRKKVKIIEGNFFLTRL